MHSRTQTTSYFTSGSRLTPDAMHKFRLPLQTKIYDNEANNRECDYSFLSEK